MRISIALFILVLGSSITIRAQTQYKVGGVCKGDALYQDGNGVGVYQCKNGKLVLDQKETDRNIDNQIKREQEEYRRQELWRALRTRVLTDSEMKEVLSFGDNINNVPEGGGMYRIGNSAERLAAFQMQLVLRQLAALKPCGETNAK